MRGKGLFLGIELVTDRATREPAPERVAMGIAGACMARGLIIGRTNRSFADYNNTLCLSPALTLSQGDADEILRVLDEVFALQV